MSHAHAHTSLHKYTSLLSLQKDEFKHNLASTREISFAILFVFSLQL